MGFDITGVFGNPPPYVFALAGVAAIVAAAMLLRLLRRHRQGTDRVQVRLGEGRRGQSNDPLRSASRFR